MNSSIKRALYFVLIYSSIQSAFSQSLKIAMLDSLHAPCAAVVAVNHKEPKNSVAGALSNALFFTIDEGQTWQKSFFKPKVSAGSNASLVCDYKGNFYFFYLIDSANSHGIALQVSEDGGRTWTFMQGPTARDTQKFQQVSAFVDYGNNIYLTWTQFESNGSECQSRILFSKSNNKGKKWSEPSFISLQPGNCNGDFKTLGSSSCALVGFEKTFVSWVDDGSILMDRAYDGKAWLSNDILVNTHFNNKVSVEGFNNGAGQLVFETDNGKSIFGSSLYVVGTKLTNENDVDILFLRSSNGGDNWMSPMKFSEDEAGTLQFRPAMTIDQETGYLYVVYYNQPNQKSEATDVFISFSKDGGASFTRKKISATPFLPASNSIWGSYAAVSVSKGVVISVWLEMTEGKSCLKTISSRQDDFLKK
jgi:hypothetical protein